MYDIHKPLSYTHIPQIQLCVFVTKWFQPLYSYGNKVI